MSWTKELFYKPYQNAKGVRFYKKNSRKLWAFIGGVIFVIWIIFLIGLVIYGIVNLERMKSYPWGTFAAITATLAGNFQFAMTLYTWSKKIDTQDGYSKADISTETGL